MINKFTRASNWFDNKLEMLIDRLYRHMKRVLLLMIAFEVLLNYSAFLSLRWYYQTMVGTTVASTAVVDVLDDRKEGKDDQWVKNIYNNDIVNDLVQEILKAVDNNDKDKVQEIAESIRTEADRATLLVSIWLVVVVAINMFVYSLFVKKIEVRLGLYRVREGVENDKANRENEENNTEAI